MALIKCPECGKEISDKAKACPNCECPMDEMTTSGTVRIKKPNNIVEGWIGLFSLRDASVSANGKVLWKDHHGENAEFTIEKPTKITINLGDWANEIEGTVSTKKEIFFNSRYGSTYACYI